MLGLEIYSLFLEQSCCFIQMHIYTPGSWIWYLVNFWMPRLLAKALQGNFHSIMKDVSREHSNQTRISLFECSKHTRAALFNTRVFESRLHHHYNPEGKSFTGDDFTKAQVQKKLGNDCRNEHSGSRATTNCNPLCPLFTWKNIGKAVYLFSSLSRSRVVF